MDRELLIEIGCEEIPASWLPGLTRADRRSTSTRVSRRRGSTTDAPRREPTARRGG